MTGEQAYLIYCELMGYNVLGWDRLSWSAREQYEHAADEVNAKIARDNERKVPYA